MSKHIRTAAPAPALQDAPQPRGIWQKKRTRKKRCQKETQGQVHKGGHKKINHLLPRGLRSHGRRAAILHKALQV